MPDPPASPAPDSSAPAPDGAKAPWVAVASVVLGVVGVLTSFVILPGLACGVCAVGFARNAAEHTGRDAGRPGRGLAIAGQALGGFAILASLVFGFIFVAEVYAQHFAGGPSGHSSQLRGIHQGLVTFANSNKEHFPGLDSKGNILFDSEEETGLSGAGDTVAARYWIMIDGYFFTPEYAIAPSDDDARVAELEYERGEPTPPVVCNATVMNYSYAMLSIEGEPGKAPESVDRAAEWQQSFNQEAIVLADRNTGVNATDRVDSYHSEDGARQWSGSVLWNDGHVTFEKTHILETRYGSGPVHMDADGEPTDNLFLPQSDDDAYLIHRGD